MQEKFIPNIILPIFQISIHLLNSGISSFPWMLVRLNFSPYAYQPLVLFLGFPNSTFACFSSLKKLFWTDREPILFLIKGYNWIQDVERHIWIIDAL